MPSSDDPARVVRVAEDETFAIELAGNPTTGYIWQADVDPAYLELLEQEFKPTIEGIGAGAREVFRFRARHAGTTEIAFACKRPWGGPPSDQRRVRVVIV
jgi:predicted secreted protein